MPQGDRRRVARDLLWTATITIAGIRIRPEAADDATAIEAVTIDAFATTAYSDRREHLIIAALRQSGQLTISLVALPKSLHAHARRGKLSSWITLQRQTPTAVAPASE